MLSYGGFGIPFGAAMLDFADDLRSFYHFAAIDDHRGRWRTTRPRLEVLLPVPSVRSSLPGAFDCQ
jgi:hypothetical protein